MVMTENPHEDAARWRKVARLIAVLYSCGIPADSVSKLNSDQWRLIAEAAYVRSPSSETIKLLLETMLRIVRYPSSEFPIPPPTSGLPNRS